MQTYWKPIARAIAMLVGVGLLHMFLATEQIAAMQPMYQNEQPVPTETVVPLPTSTVSPTQPANVVEATSSYAVGWGALSLINAGIAQGKNRNGGNWFLVSIFLGPIATLLLVTSYPKLLEPPR